MYVVSENTTKKDIIFRLAIIILTAHEASDLVQHIFNWGSQFDVLSQAIGVFVIWAVIGMIRCVIFWESRGKFVHFMVKLINATKWGRH
jgi:hypothetical protein